MAWFWATTIESEAAWLTEAEVRHLQRVLRKRPGAPVALIDGAGKRARGVWSGSARVDVFEVEVWRRRELTLILGLGARETTEDSLRRAAELGAATILPVWTARSVDAGAQKRVDLERWRRIVASGCAQAGNPWLPALHAPASWTEVRARLGAVNITVLHPGATAAPPPAAVVLAVGPEGGFTADELAGCGTATLGPYVLRTPVAVAVALGALAQTWEPQCAA